MNGYGEYYYKDGSIYVGEFYENLLHGEGKLILANGNTYEGEFEYGEYSGHGKHTFGNWIYVGQHYKGLRHGYGELINNVTGEYYKGYFLDGFAHGYGETSWCGNEKTAIKGQWANGQYIYRKFIPKNII